MCHVLLLRMNTAGPRAVEQPDRDAAARHRPGSEAADGARQRAAPRGRPEPGQSRRLLTTSEVKQRATVSRRTTIERTRRANYATRAEGAGVPEVQGVQHDEQRFSYTTAGPRIPVRGCPGERGGYAAAGRAGSALMRDVTLVSLGARAREDGRASWGASSPPTTAERRSTRRTPVNADGVENAGTIYRVARLVKKSRRIGDDGGDPGKVATVDFAIGEVGNCSLAP